MTLTRVSAGKRSGSQHDAGVTEEQGRAGTLDKFDLSKPEPVSRPSA